MREIIGGIVTKAERGVLLEGKRFSPEDLEALKQRGFVIYPLTGQSIRSLREEERKFWANWDERFPNNIRSLTSTCSEVAINPTQVFLRGSNNKTLEKQREMVRAFSREIARGIPRVEAVIGQAPDYAELAFLYQEKTGKCLFGDYNHTRTETDDVCVGSNEGGLVLSTWPPDRGDSLILVAPLVVPK